MNHRERLGRVGKCSEYITNGVVDVFIFGLYRGFKDGFSNRGHLRSNEDSLQVFATIYYLRVHRQ